MLKRTWVSPFVGFSFLMISITGLLMMMHVQNHLITGLHEWLGVLFIITGLFHLALNWKPFLACFRSRQGAAATIAAIVISALLAVGGYFHGHDKNGNGTHYRYDKMRHSR